MNLTAHMNSGKRLHQKNTLKEFSIQFSKRKSRRLKIIHIIHIHIVIHIKEKLYKQKTCLIMKLIEKKETKSRERIK